MPQQRSLRPASVPQEPQKEGASPPVQQGEPLVWSGLCLRQDAVGTSWGRGQASGEAGTPNPNPRSPHALSEGPRVLPTAAGDPRDGGLVTAKSDSPATLQAASPWKRLSFLTQAPPVLCRSDPPSPGTDLESKLHGTPVGSPRDGAGRRARPALHPEVPSEGLRHPSARPHGPAQGGIARDLRAPPRGSVVWLPGEGDAGAANIMPRPHPQGQLAIQGPAWENKRPEAHSREGRGRVLTPRPGVL